MDIISFNEASTANGRIEKFINEPDSTSGIVTVPKVIASTETITIPAGRVAILPNVQIDGVLNVEGEVFIPSGATLGDLDAQLALKAPLVSPAFTNPTATTQAAQDNSTKVATTAYVDGKMVLGTAVASTSGTAIDFTGIPSWVKRITVMFAGVSTTGTSNLLIKIGSGSIDSTGYLSTVSVSTLQFAFTDGFGISAPSVPAGATIRGSYMLDLISTNTWICTGLNSRSNDSAVTQAAGSKLLSGTLDRLRITTVSGSDTFDLGLINIRYEG